MVEETDVALSRKEPGSGRRRAWALGAAAAVIAALAVAGLGVAGAQPAPSESDVERAERPAAGHPHPKAMRDAVHGELVVRDGDGFRTVALQTGEVTDVSASAMTVKSADGYTRTYGVDDNTMVNAGRDGIADVKKGDTVRVHAVVRGDAVRATHVADVTAIAAHRRHWAPAPGAGRPPGR